MWDCLVVLFDTTALLYEVPLRVNMSDIHTHKFYFISESHQLSLYSSLKWHLVVLAWIKMYL